MPSSLTIAGQKIKPGTRQRLQIALPKLYDFTDMTMPVEVIRGKEDGPVMFLSAALHGDEINGVEIVRQILMKKAMKSLKGTLIAVPIVNVYGFNAKSRYLPDRRDLNRNFPGGSTGSLTAQLAHIFMTEIVEKCTHGVDLHCAAINRVNLPQIRACLEDSTVEQMARAFGAPVILDNGLRPGSLRETAHGRGIPIILFEGGEALRFNEKVIKSGVNGVISVMRSIGMLKSVMAPKIKNDRFVAKSSHWIRASNSGIVSMKKKLGQRVKKGQLMAVISDPLGQDRFEMRARRSGIIIGAATLPLLNRGDAVFHVATFDDAEAVEEHLDMYEDAFEVEDNSRFIY